MKNTQKGFVVPLIITIIVLLIAGGVVYVAVKNKNASQSNSYSNDNIPVETTSNTTVSNTPNSSIPSIHKTQKNTPIATGRGSGGISIPTVNDFSIISPSNGQTWDKGDSSKTINWTYPSELKGHSIHLSVYLVNLDLIAKGRDVGDPDVGLDIYTGLTNVPNSGNGEIAWDLLRPIPETAFYGYSGNSRIVVLINDSDSLKSYNSASDIFVVSTTVKTSAPIVPTEITSPNSNTVYNTGDTLEVKWTGSTHSSDICDVSLVGPLDQSGQVIQSLGAIIPIGGPTCSSGDLSWKINSPYIHGGYNYNIILKTPYSSYSRTIKIAQ